MGVIPAAYGGGRGISGCVCVPEPENACLCRSRVGGMTRADSPAFRQVLGSEHAIDNAGNTSPAKPGRPGRAPLGARAGGGLLHTDALRAPEPDRRHQRRSCPSPSSSYSQTRNVPCPDASFSIRLPTSPAWRLSLIARTITRRLSTTSPSFVSAYSGSSRRGSKRAGFSLRSMVRKRPERS